MPSPTYFQAHLYGYTSEKAWHFFYTFLKAVPEGFEDCVQDLPISPEFALISGYGAQAGQRLLK